MPIDEHEYLGTFTIGDMFPFPYFILYEAIFNIGLKRIVDQDLVPSDYTAIKFCARHEDNNKDVDDHSKDEIYSNLTNVSGNVYKYIWLTGNIAKVGRYYVRLELERASDAKKFHAPGVWYFIAERKMPGKFGDL